MNLFPSLKFFQFVPIKIDGAQKKGWLVGFFLIKSSFEYLNRSEQFSLDWLKRFVVVFSAENVSTDQCEAIIFFAPEKKNDLVKEIVNRDKEIKRLKTQLSEANKVIEFYRGKNDSGTFAWMYLEKYKGGDK